MGQCRYEHDGVKTCNIDTQLFKDSSQEDLFPDYCYFHQTEKMFDYAQRILKDKFSEVKNPTDAHVTSPKYNNKIKQILLFLLSFRVKLSSDKLFFENFHKLMNEKCENQIDISGFNFPVVTKDAQNFILINPNERLNWSNNIVCQNISSFSIDFIDNKIRDIVVSRIFSPVISNTLLKIYQKKQSDNDSSQVPGITNSDFNNLNDREILKYIPYKQGCITNIQIKEVFNNPSRNIGEENQRASILNNIFKDIITEIIKDMDIEKVLDPHGEASQDAIAYIKFVLQNMEVSEIREYIDMDAQAAIYKSIGDSNSHFSKFMNDIQNYSFLGEIREISIMFQNIVLNGNMKIIGDKLYQNYVFKKCEFNSQNIDITASILDFWKNAISDKNQLLKIITENTSIRSCEAINSKKIIIHSQDLKISNSYFSDNVLDIELAVRLWGLKLSFPFSKTKSLFSDITKINIYDGYNPNSYHKEQEGQGLIQYVNLKNVRFHECNKNEKNRENHYENLNQLRFVHCEFNDGHKLYEDTNFHTFPNEEQAGVLKRLEYNYRYLRKYYDEKGDYIEGNDFHYNYMEAKRKNTENAADKGILLLYKLINGYNTKPEYTLQLILGIVILTALWHTIFRTFDIQGLYDHNIIKLNMITYSFFGLFWISIAFSITMFIDRTKDRKQTVIIYWMLLLIILPVLLIFHCVDVIYDLLFPLIYFGYAVMYSTLSLIPTLKSSDIFIPINPASNAIGILGSMLGVILIALLIMALRNRFRRSKSEDEFK